MYLQVEKICCLSAATTLVTLWLIFSKHSPKNKSMHILNAVCLVTHPITVFCFLSPDNESLFWFYNYNGIHSFKVIRINISKNS